jgi:hypothetical protein
MRTNAEKKTPADYPQMIFRVSQTDKDRLHQLIEQVTDLANEHCRESAKKFRKNDVIVDALFLGLLSLEKRLAKRKGTK